MLHVTNLLRGAFLPSLDAFAYALEISWKIIIQSITIGACTQNGHDDIHIIQNRVIPILILYVVIFYRKNETCLTD